MQIWTRLYVKEEVLKGTSDPVMPSLVTPEGSSEGIALPPWLLATLDSSNLSQRLKPCFFCLICPSHYLF